MKILLISPKCSNRLPEIYNVGLAYIGAVLKSDGHDIRLVDLNINGKKPAEIIDEIKRSGKPDAVGMGTIVTAFNHVRWLIDEIKKIYPDVPVWAGNSVASTIPEIFLQNTKADVVVAGEGENTARELAAGRAFEDIDGIHYRKNGQIIQTRPREVISDLDSLPFPAHELFDQEAYTSVRQKKHGKTFTLGASSRGCPYHCTYCYHAYQGMKPRYHSAGRMLDELEYALGRYNFDFFGWADDLFISNRKRVFEFCDLIEKAKIKKKWGATARVNLVDEELLKRMKSAGCVWVGFGIESGSQKILDNIKKGVTVSQAKNALALCKKASMDYTISLMIGNVGENEETAAETVRFVEETDSCPPSSLFLATPYPGTELYEYGLRTGKIKDEDALIKSYGEQATTLLVNFSELPDNDLLSLKEKTEKNIKRVYIKRHPFLWASALFGEFVFAVKAYGLPVALLKGTRKILGAVTGNHKY
ncbi:MAG: radical SAM protein [Nitrospiraceae bacterium]|nr:radical SAM protein [Nitrospiraceae bacterium]